MGLLDTLRHWAEDAWHLFTGAPAAVARAFRTLWRFVSQVNTLLQWLVRFPLWNVLVGIVETLAELRHFNDLLSDALDRLRHWVLTDVARPLRADLERRIRRVEQADIKRGQWIWAGVLSLAYYGRKYSRHLFNTERHQRVMAVKAARHYTRQQVKWALSVVQSEAASAYALSVHDRVSIITRIIDDLAGRNPVIKGIESKLVTAVLDLLSVDDPLVKLLVGFLVRKIINDVGIDKVAAQLLKQLLDSYAADPKPRSLYGVIKDIGARLVALESGQADFMEAGGPEVEQAGRQWKAITSVLGDIAVLAFVGQAVAAPAAWATELTDVIGKPVDDALSAVVSLIGKA